MWRSVFLALGIVLCVIGGECLIMEKAVLARDEAETDTSPLMFAAPTITPAPEIKPPEWAAWSLLSTGAVVILYSYSLPRRNG